MSASRRAWPIQSSRSTRPRCTGGRVASKRSTSVACHAASVAKLVTPAAVSRSASFGPTPPMIVRSSGVAGWAGWAGASTAASSCFELLGRLELLDHSLDVLDRPVDRHDLVDRLDRRSDLACRSGLAER